MHLKRLEVFGFKSFADKTVLEFQPGIAAIVGPNGCGKSNVFDAVRWVLGEQSVKDLRGSAMEDVIFSGTDKRAPLGFAEVTLVFSNERRILPHDMEEVSVSRRLFRSGESEYLINKQTARLRDIVEMFLGTGVGAEAYSLIQQGRVDMVVSAKPEDRRQIFDEAAGITKYKAKKKEALSKLKETEDNLLRINDIVVEVKRQIATIERQAKKARDYKENFVQLRTLELMVAQFNMSQYDGQLKEIRDQLASFNDREEENLEQLNEYNDRIAYEENQIAELDEKINELRSQQIRLENDIALNERQIIFNSQRLSEIANQLQTLEADKVAALERCKFNQVKIDELKAQLEQLIQALTSAQHAIDFKKEELVVLINSIGQAQGSIKSVEAEIFGLNASEVRVKNQLTDNLKRVMENTARQTRLHEESTKIVGEKEEVTVKFHGINSAIGDTKVGLESLWGTLNGQRSQAEELQLKLSHQEDAIDQLEHTRVFLVSQKDFIAKMQVQYQDIPDPIVEGRFIVGIRPNDKQTGIIGKIKAVNVIPASETSSEMYEIVYETKYIELDLAHMQTRIESLDAQLVDAHQAHEQITRERGILNGTIDGTLKQIQDQEKKLSVLESQKNDIELETGKIVGELDLLSVETSQVSADLAQLKEQETLLQKELSGIASHIQSCQGDIKGKQQEIALAQERREGMQVSIASEQAQLNGEKDKQQSFQQQIDLFAGNLDRDLNDIARFDTQKSEQEAKLAAIDEESINLEAKIESVRGQQEALTADSERLLAQKNEFTQRLTVLRHQTRALEDAIIEAKTQLHNMQMREQELSFNTRTLKERLSQTFKLDWDELVNPPAQTIEEVVEQAIEQLPPAEANGEITEVTENGEAIVVLEPPPAPVAKKEIITLPEIPADVNWEEVNSEIERLRKKCESYGAVNLVAIEEFDELKNRYEFLTKQQSDLLTAREQLLSTVQKINRTTREMFTTTFTRVNEEFIIYFRQLFGGGEAQLILLDPQNALECGIDIIARPPGKKPQSISLLSGGEKTLTAIAMIFAVFKVNPSPFCVLDEIDAALDESNVGRFANMLREFAQIAQFIIITHNKRTMQVADIMYGVTMQERGVSRIVSVKLNDFTPQTPAKPNQEVLATV